MFARQVCLLSSHSKVEDFEGQRQQEMTILSDTSLNWNSWRHLQSNRYSARAAAADKRYFEKQKDQLSLSSC